MVLGSYAAEFFFPELCGAAAAISLLTGIRRLRQRKRSWLCFAGCPIGGLCAWFYYCSVWAEARRSAHRWNSLDGFFDLFPRHSESLGLVLLIMVVA